MGLVSLLPEFSPVGTHLLNKTAFQVRDRVPDPVLPYHGGPGSEKGSSTGAEVDIDCRA